MAIKTDTFTGGGGGGAGTDTLDDVTGRGSSTTNSITVGGVSIGTEYTLPTADGLSNQFIKTDGAGALSFAALDITGGLEYKGSYDASTNSPLLTNAEKGDFYIISAAGTRFGRDWSIGDHLLINEDMGGVVSNGKIDKIDNTEPTNVLITTNNLSDLDNAGTARTNLGLGTAATLDTGTANGNIVVLDATGLPAVDGSQLTGITATDSTKLAIANNLSDLNNAVTARTNLGLGTAATSASTDFLQVSNNLSDINNAGTARTNLGLGTSATLDTGTSNGNVVVLDATGLPAVDGSQLTGVVSTDSSKLAIANNLSDLNNVGTARTNLGLGTSATLNTGTSNGNVVVLDATGLPAVDGSQLTGITATDSTKLAIANNLSDLNNAVTARTNLGLGTASLSASTDFLASTAGLDDLSDVAYTPGAGIDNYVLTYDHSTTSWGAEAAAGGGGGWTYSAITADPANAQASYHYSCTGTFTITLATTGMNAGEEIRIKNMGTGDITVDPQTSTIDGATTDYVLDVQYSAITLVSTGSNWEII